MKANAGADTSNWGTLLINGVLYPFALFGAPLFLAALLIYLIAEDFSDSVNDGLRSFAAALLPLMVVTFLWVFRSEPVADSIERVPRLVAFTATLGIGVLVMALLRAASSAPLPELVMSGSFSLLVFSSVTLERDRKVAYFFGIITGFLLFIILWGFPTLD